MFLKFSFLIPTLFNIECDLLFYVYYPCVFKQICHMMFDNKLRNILMIFIFYFIQTDKLCLTPIQTISVNPNCPINQN